ncbi:PGC-1 and ERR-induced regulator in muscle protein 1 isoform X1 [Triplophysa rosa]|nr:PGC-1 and ERR-induced regulator in muscle protein 1 isoform X1 [Triplophysa rosa]
MDDFEYSLHISDQAWDTFFQECEGCNLLSPGLASREDSGMSDIDEMGSHFLGVTRLPGTAESTEPDLQVDGPPDCEGSPVDNYLSKYGIGSPEQVLSGSEEDLHLQTVNLFFEQLKSITVNEQPLEQSHVENCGSEKTDHLEGLIDNQDIQYVVICPSGRIEAIPKGEISKQGEADTWGSTAIEKAVMPTCTNAQVNASDSPERETVIGGESLSSQLITVGVKREQEKRRCDLSAELKLKPETKPPDKVKMPPMEIVNWIDMTVLNPAKGSIDQLEIGSSSDSKVSPIIQIPVSPFNLRRKRRKKKRISMEAGEMSPGHEAQIRIHQSESEDERFVQREEINNLPINVKMIEPPSIPEIKISPILHNSDHLLQCFAVGAEAPTGLKCSKSLPESFTTFDVETIPQVRQTSICNISKSMKEMSLVNNRHLKAEVQPKSILAEKVLNVQESDVALKITESASTIQLRETDCSPTPSLRETISESLNDNSPAGCQRKSLLSPNISSAADSTEPLSSLVSFNLTEDTHKDVSCLGNEIDCYAFKSEKNLPNRWIMTGISDVQQSSSSVMEKIDDVEPCSDGNTSKMFSQNTLHKERAVTCVDILKSQTCQLRMGSPLSETHLETECNMMENTVVSDGKDEGHIQNNNEVLMVNASLIKPDNSTQESEGKKDKSVNEDGVVEFKNNGEHLLNDIANRSIEHIFNEHSTQNALSDVSEISPPTAAESQGTFSGPLESESGSKDPENIVLGADQIPSPVFAISSFWNEMEKLTINDILRLRMIGSAQHPSVLTQPDDRSVSDTSDAADSGYFTQPDDSKPERLSGDMSFISDLDEDLLQLQTQYSLKQDDEPCGFPSRSCSVMWENDSDPAMVGEDVVYISSETALPEHLYAADAQQCFRKMCKNISVQNLQDLEAQPIRQMMRNASLRSIHSEAEDPFYHVNTSYPTCLSDDEDLESGGITFSEIIQYFFSDDEPERCSSRADNNTTPSYLEESGTSVPEMYDHFFSEFDSGSFFNPFENDQMVPIFSSTRSNRNLQFPEAYDSFFPDSPVHSDEDDDNDYSPIKVVSRYDQKSSNHYSVASTDMYEHFYPEDTFKSDLLWANPFSLRRVRRSDPAVPEENSWALTPVKPFHKGIQSITVIGPDDKPFPDSLYLNLENRIFQQLAEQQKKCMEMQTVVADPRLDSPFLPLRQADMCLVCIAFASWVLKSASPGADTWKAALLANVSALSAIRYLRRHKREEVSGKTSLRQIEPA